jgi:hypothetical protein
VKSVSRTLKLPEGEAGVICEHVSGVWRLLLAQVSNQFSWRQDSLNILNPNGFALLPP